MLPNLLTPLPRESLKELEDHRGGGSSGDRRERWLCTSVAITAMLAGAFVAMLTAW